MKVFIFDLLPYAQHFEDYKRDKFIPYPLPRRSLGSQDRRADL